MRFISFLFIFSTGLTAQQDPFFMPFEGPVYKIPAQHVMKNMGYGEHVLDYEVIGEISWKEINIPNQTTDTPFPDVERIDRFGMILKSEMIIKQDGRYEFLLNSDDGSILWIQDEEIINNDKMHKMEMKKDTLTLKKGKYPIRIWYHQAFIHKYGFIFDAKYLDAVDNSKQDFHTFAKAPKKISMSSSVLFDISSATLDEEGKERLDSIFHETIDQYESLTVKGYTCNIGSASQNRSLSQARADAVAQYLNGRVKGHQLKIVSIGMGESNPIHDNHLPKGREKNRRVELVFK